MLTGLRGRPSPLQHTVAKHGGRDEMVEHARTTHKRFQNSKSREVWRILIECCEVDIVVK